jgi:hypothetical protein
MNIALLFTPEGVRLNGRDILHQDALESLCAQCETIAKPHDDVWLLEFQGTVSAPGMWRLPAWFLMKVWPKRQAA